MNNKSSNYYGISSTGLLGVAFVILKLLHVINWSWWWVTSPFWVPLALFIVFILVVLCIKGAAKFIVNRGF